MANQQIKTLTDQSKVIIQQRFIQLEEVEGYGLVLVAADRVIERVRSQHATQDAFQPVFLPAEARRYWDLHGQKRGLGKSFRHKQKGVTCMVYFLLWTSNAGLLHSYMGKEKGYAKKGLTKAAFFLLRAFLYNYLLASKKNT